MHGLAREADLTNHVNEGTAQRVVLGEEFPLTSLEVAGFMQSPMGEGCYSPIGPAWLAPGERGRACSASGQGLKLIDVLEKLQLDNLIIGVPKLMHLVRLATFA